MNLKSGKNGLRRFQSSFLAAADRSSTFATSGSPGRLGAVRSRDSDSHTNSVTRLSAAQSSRLYARSVSLSPGSPDSSHDRLQTRLWTPDASSEDHEQPRNWP